MGTLAGHLLPGSFFFLFGLWCAVQSYRRYFRCKRDRAQFTSTITYPCSCLCGRLKQWPIEAFLKLLVIALGITGEIITGFRNGEFHAVGNGQHATMFFFFGIAALIDILLYFKASLPSNIDFISHALAFGVEAVLFRYHLAGRTPLDLLIHTLLLYVVLASLVMVFVEMRYRHNVLSPLARAYFLMVQGTWFWHVGYILYPPLEGHTWNEQDHEEMMLATMYFSWHGGANFTLLLVIGVLISCCYKTRTVAFSNDLNMKRLVQTSGRRVLADVNERGEEIETEEVHFQKLGP